MVYCDKIHDAGDHAVYSFGASAEDMTGEIIFRNDLTVEVKQEPKQYHVALNWLYKLLSKYKTDFKNGVFKDHIAYES